MSPDSAYKRSIPLAKTNHKSLCFLSDFLTAKNALTNHLVEEEIYLVFHSWYDVIPSAIKRCNSELSHPQMEFAFYVEGQTSFFTNLLTILRVKKAMFILGGLTER